MRYYLVIFINLIVSGLWAQDYLSPLRYNAQIYSSQASKLLSARSSQDTVNYNINRNPLNLPFLDEFSSDRRRPRDLSNYPFFAYYMTGICVEKKGFVKARHKLSTTQTFFYPYNAAKPPLYRDTFVLSPSFVYGSNDTPNCNLVTITTWYPCEQDIRYNAAGDTLSNVQKFDTILYSAFVKDITLKNSIWIDHYSYINNHYPVMPLGKGVATLDGLNENGRPYEPYVTNAYGQADYLTSEEIALSGLQKKDSLYLSFLYQPQGFGDWPDYQDSLVVEFKGDDEKWTQVWSTPGLKREQNTDTLRFKQALISFPEKFLPQDPNFFHNKFQFRFKNYATISGNNDHWHIDYVRLDSGRNQNDTSIKDATFVYDLPTILKNYTLLPARQFVDDSMIKDTIVALNRNLPAGNFNIYRYICKNLNTGTVYDQSNSAGIPYTANALTEITLKHKSVFSIPNPIPDSTYIKTQIYMDNGDLYIGNDTATTTQLFYNEMAHDDGTAEMAYGVGGIGVKKMAFKFNIPRQDTLAAIKLHFSNIDVDPSTIIFNLNVWSQIGLNGQTEKIIKTISNKKPVYDAKNNLGYFVTYGLDTPIIIKDSIYVGWTQTDDKNLTIGLDLNTDFGFDKIYFFGENVWKKASIKKRSSPMIRLILDGTRNYRGSSNNASIGSSLDLIQSDYYPNPCEGMLNLEVDNYLNTIVNIVDMMGKSVYQSSFRQMSRIDISHLNQGMYFIHLSQNDQLIKSGKLMLSK